MYHTFIPAGRSPYLSVALEPSVICNFKELATPHYSCRILREWSARWVPSYAWSYEGLIADPIVTSLFHRLVVIPNSYTLFRYHAGSCIPIDSYSSLASQAYHRSLYPSMHSLQEDSARANQSKHALISSGNGSLDFILLWHSDHANYWHFTFDIAFRLFYFVTLFPLLIPRLRLVVVGTNSLTAFQHDLLAAILGSKPNLVFSSVSAVVESAVYIPPVQTLLPRKDWLVSYSRFLSSRLTSNTRLNCFHNNSSANVNPKMFYIQRGKSKNPRVLLNEAEVMRSLEERGFTVCDPGALTIYEQARLFRSADLVVGPHGSAFVNTLYMKPGSRVIEFTNSTYDPFHDFLLSRQLNISFIRIRQNDNTTQTSGFMSSHQPFLIDIEKVKRAVSPLSLLQ